MWGRDQFCYLYYIICLAEGAKFIEVDHDKKLFWEKPIQLVWYGYVYEKV